MTDVSSRTRVSYDGMYEYVEYCYESRREIDDDDIALFWPKLLKADFIDDCYILDGCYWVAHSMDVYRVSFKRRDDGTWKMFAITLDGRYRKLRYCIGEQYRYGITLQRFRSFKRRTLWIVRNRRGGMVGFFAKERCAKKCMESLDDNYFCMPGNLRNLH